MMTVRTGYHKRIDISYRTDEEADTLEADLVIQLRGNEDYENNRIVVGRNTDEMKVYVIFYNDILNTPPQKVLV